MIMNIKYKKVLNEELLLELKDNSLLKNKPNIWEIVDLELNTMEEILKATKNSNKKLWWNCFDCNGTYDASCKDKFNSRKCPYCSKKRILIGFNDLNTTNKKLSLLLNDYSDGYKYTEFSSKKIDFKCNKCESVIKNKTIKDVNIYGLSCKNCKDSLSYSERLMKNILLNLEIEFESEKKFKWKNLNNRRYDYYLPKYNAIIELHGKQHYQGGFESLGGNSFSQELINDSEKMQIALENNISHYIVIDCRESNFEYIMSNIKKSKLKYLINIDSIDLLQLQIDSENTNSLECLNIWNNEKSDVDYISKKLKLHRNTVRSYLRNWSKLKKCNFNDVDSKFRKILQFDLNDNLIKEWNSLSEIIETEYGNNKLIKLEIEKVLKNIVENYDGYKWKVKNNSKKFNKGSKVVQLTMNDEFVNVYDSITKAVLINNFKSVSSISNCCNKSRNSYKGFKWMFLDEYNNLLLNSGM